MNQPMSFPFGMPTGFNGLSESTRQSFAAVSNAYSEWLHNANRLQAEMIRFAAERFNKDVGLISRFAGCHEPGEFLKLQSEAMAELAKDYMEQGARIVALYGDASMAAGAAPGKKPGSARKA